MSSSNLKANLKPFLYENNNSDSNRKNKKNKKKTKEVSKNISLDDKTPIKEETIEESKEEPIHIKEIKEESVEKNENEDELSSDEDLEKELTKYGYIIVSKVIINDKNKKVLFLKVINEHGQKVLVEFDVSGYILSLSQNDILLNKNNINLENNYSAEIIPYSYKIGTFECAKLLICGIAFECQKDLCTLKKTTELASNEEKFTIYYPGDRGQFTNYPIIYPIVKMSEIRENPKLILTNTDLVMKRIRNCEYLKTQDDLKKFTSLLKNITESFDTFNKYQADRFNNICKSIDTLDNYIVEYEKIFKNDVQALIDPDTLDKYKNTIKNIYMRYDLLDQLIIMCQNICKISNSLNIVNNSILDSNNILKNKIEYNNPELLL